MDDIKKIAISQVASVLSDTRLIVPEEDIWKQIFYNAGLSRIYDEQCDRLNCKQISVGLYEHNDNCYSALYDIFLSLLEEFDMFTKLMNSIAYKLNKYLIFNDKYIKVARVERIFGDKDITKSNELLQKYPSKDFKRLRDNLNILSLDFSFEEEYGEHLNLLPFEFIDKKEKRTVLIEWLNYRYPNILDSYQDALKAYGNGDNAGTITHCRNIITGIFSYSKQENSKWLTGLQFACNKDKNLINVDKPNSIPQMIHIKKSDVSAEEYEQISDWKKYNYPRFRLIYQVYSYLCDLGPHITEAPLVNGVPDCESVDQYDALMGLRMTEDILIWLYQCNINSL